MSSKQFFAQVGVFLLVAANLGAYYFFWPTRNQPQPVEVENRAAKALFATELKRPGQGTRVSGAEESSVPTMPIPPHVGTATTVGNLAKAAKKDDLPVPGGIANPDRPAPPVKPLPTAEEAITLPSIPEVGGLPKVPDIAAAPKPEAPANNAQDQTLEMLRKAKELIQKNVESQAVESGGGVPIVVEGNVPEPKPFPPKVEPKRPAEPTRASASPWLLQMEIVGGQTVLTAQLHKSLELKITCQRVEMKTPDGSVLALGQVSFLGPGLRGACEKLTLPLNDDRLVLDGKAEVQIEQRPDAKGDFYRAAGNPTAELRAEQLTLRLPAQPSAAPASAAPLQPAGGVPSIIPAPGPGAAAPLFPTSPLRPMN